MQEPNGEIAMNRYETLIPRVAWGIAAVAMTAITIGVSVVMPAKWIPTVMNLVYWRR